VAVVVLDGSTEQSVTVEHDLPVLVVYPNPTVNKSYLIRSNLQQS